MEKMSYSVMVQMVGGPSLPIFGFMELDAYEKITVTVPKKTDGTNGSADVVVSPGDLDDTKALIITSSIEDGKVSFKTSKAGAQPNYISGPITLIGSTACKLLGTKPDKLSFTNAGDNDADITIFVGRSAT